MQKIRKSIAFMLALALLLPGCGSVTDDGSLQIGDGTIKDPSNNDAAVVSTVVDPGDMFSNRDFETAYDTGRCEKITLDGNTVQIQKEGTYILSGTLEDGQVVVNAKNTDKIQLVLNGVNINSNSSAAIFVQQADKVFITTAKGTENTLSNGGSFAQSEYNIDAVVFSKDDLTLNGRGNLTIVSPAGHGVVSKDDLVVTCGDYTVTAAGHGLCGKESVRIAGGTFSLTAGKDGIHGENNDDTTLGFGYFSGGSFQISAQGDGISTSNSLLFSGGDFHITAGGGSENGTKASSDNYGGFMGGGFGGGRPNGGRPGDKGNTGTDESSTSMKGIKATGDLTIHGGTFTINSADDSVHSNANITVTGGVFRIATGDDGFHADENLTVEAADIQITESYEGLEGHHILVSGGEISLVSSDDGLNAAGGVDSSGMGGRDQMFGGGKGGPGGMGGMHGSGDGSIVISGGTLYIQASGDGIDANGTLEITGGDTIVCGPTQGDTATLDYDVSATITGGTFIGTGGSMMAQSFSNSQQGVIALRVGTCQANTQLTLTDANGETVISYAPKLDYGVVILSSPDIIQGESYTITIGTQSGTFEAS
jgi:hypothetical protein